MSDYLSRLAARTLNMARVVQPRLPNRFEPPPAIDVLSVEAPVAERVPTTSVRRMIDDAEPAKPRAHSTREDHAPSIQPATSAFHHTTVSTTGSDPDHRERVVAESIAGRPLEPRPIVEVASRPTKVSGQTDDAAPVPSTVAALHQTKVPERPRETLGTLTAIERENPNPAAKRADGQVRGDLLAAPAPQASAVRSEAASPASITVRIGRIEVRAVAPAPPLPKRPAASLPAPTLALKDYLKGRRERRR